MLLFRLVRQGGKQLFSYLFEHRATHLADIPVALSPYFGDPCGTEQPDSAEEQQFLVFLIQFQKDL